MDRRTVAVSNEEVDWRFNLLENRNGITIEDIARCIIRGAQQPSRAWVDVDPVVLAVEPLIAIAQQRGGQRNRTETLIDTGFHNDPSAS
jgi:hypothetical protein